MVGVSTSYSCAIIFCVSQIFSSAYTACTPPSLFAATNVRYSAADERVIDVPLFLDVLSIANLPGVCIQTVCHCFCP